MKIEVVILAIFSILAVQGCTRYKNRPVAELKENDNSQAQSQVNTESELISHEQDISIRGQAISRFNSEFRKQVLSISKSKYSSLNTTGSVPELLSLTYSNSQLLDFGVDQDWSADFDGKLKTEWRVHPEIEQHLAEQTQKVVDLAMTDKLTDEIFNIIVTETADLVVLNAPRKCELVKSLRQIDIILANVCKKAKNFDYEIFTNEVKYFIKNCNESSNCLFTENEKQDFKYIILATNSNFYRFNLNKNNLWLKFIIQSFMDYTNEYILLNYDKVMSSIDLKYIKFNEFQSKNKINQKLQKFLNLSEPFKLSINDVIDSNRIDNNFIKLLELNQNQNQPLKEGITQFSLKTNESFVSGVAPTHQETYDFNLKLSMLSFVERTEVELQIVLTFIVGQNHIDIGANQSKDKIFLLYLTKTQIQFICIIILIVSVVSIAICIIRARKSVYDQKKSQTVKYIQTQFQEESKCEEKL